MADDKRNTEFEQRLYAVKQQREKAALEAEAGLSDGEKIALAKKRKEEEEHAKKNPYRRPSLIEGQLGIFAGKPAQGRGAGGRGRGRGRGRGSAARKSQDARKSVFDIDQIDPEKDSEAPEQSSAEESAAEGVQRMSLDTESVSSVASPSVSSEDIGKEDLEAANENDDSDKLDVVKTDQVDFEKTSEGEFMSLKAPVLQLRMRNTKQLSLGFRKYAWKTVVLVLREDSVELFKTADETVRHKKLDLEKITVMEIVADIANGFKLATASGDSLEVRAASKEEAEGWIKAVKHNQNVLKMQKSAETKD